jgi:hypothetical protein
MCGTVTSKSPGVYERLSRKLDVRARDANGGPLACVTNPDDYVAHALVHPLEMKTLAKHRHECRCGTHECVRHETLRINAT